MGANNSIGNSCFSQYIPIANNDNRGDEGGGGEATVLLFRSETAKPIWGFRLQINFFLHVLQANKC